MIFNVDSPTTEEYIPDFVHLHVHTQYSLLDGACSIPNLVKRVKELGMNTIAITDHNHLGGTLAFQKQCKLNDIKPLLGVEMYYTDDINIASLTAEERHLKAYTDYYNKEYNDDLVSPEDISDKLLKKYKDEYERYEYDMTQYHILFIATNQTGWDNLVKLQSEAAAKCTYNGRFLCDYEMIKKYNEGIICTTACIGSKFSKLITKKSTDKAEQLILKFKEVFNDRFYLEIQPLQLDKQYLTNLFYLEMSERHNIKTVATNDVHYILESDWDDHDSLVCLSTGANKYDKSRMKYSNDFWLRSAEEMVHYFNIQNDSIGIQHDVEKYKAFFLKAMENTVLLANSVSDNIQIGSKKPLLPKIKTDGYASPEDALTIKAYQGLEKYYKEHPEIDINKYRERLTQELNVINNKGFAEYMLVVQENIAWGDEHGVIVGPGRGSAAGSLVLYMVGITKNCDPIKDGLLFSRFLTPDRKDLPDIDVDYSYYERPLIIEHFKDYYGESKVAHIGTWTTLGVASGVKDFGRVLGLEYTMMNDITSKLDELIDKSPDGAKPSFKQYDALKDEDEKKYKEFCELEQKAPEAFRLARKFEGNCRQYSVHASGVLVSPVDVSDVIPTRIDKEGNTVTLYTGPECEEAGNVKLDILGLKTLNVIGNCLKSIGKDINWLYNNVDLNDKKIYDYISSKETDGVFQIESDMFKGIIGLIKPTQKSDLTALAALGRPGPMSVGAHISYAKRKNGEEEITYPIRGCNDIFEETYGVVVYQEQLMKIAQRIAGFDDGQADSLVRKTFA